MLFTINLFGMITIIYKHKPRTRMVKMHRTVTMSCKDLLMSRYCKQLDDDLRIKDDEEQLVHMLYMYTRSYILDTHYDNLDRPFDPISNLRHCLIPFVIFPLLQSILFQSNKNKNRR